MSSLVTVEASYLPLAPDPAIAGVRGWLEGILFGRMARGAGAPKIGKVMARGRRRRTPIAVAIPLFIGCRNPKGPITASQASPLPDILVTLCVSGMIEIIDHIP